MDAKEKNRSIMIIRKERKKNCKKDFGKKKKMKHKKKEKKKKTVSRFDTKKIKRTRFENIFLLTMKQF